MADVLSQTPPSGLAAQEARRLALQRAQRQGRGFSETGEPAMAGPGPIDVDSRVRRVPFVGRAAQRLHDRGVMNVVDTPSRYLDAEAAATRRGAMAAEVGQEKAALSSFLSGRAPTASSQAVDQAIGNESREQRLGSMLQVARNPARQGASAERGGGGGKTAGPAGAVGGGNAAGGLKQMKQQVGAAIIKSCWSNLLLSFGHTIYVIDIMFLLGWASKFLREYIPEVGMEWLPQQTRDLVPKSAVLPLKLAEIVAMAFITFFLVMIDVAILSMVVLIISVLMAVGAGVAKAI